MVDGVRSEERFCPRGSELSRVSRNLLKKSRELLSAVLLFPIPSPSFEILDEILMSLETFNNRGKTGVLGPFFTPFKLR
jgi:hypothetical protein